ncbi:MAG: carboxymuconolactone decarboxylase family protein [Alphaproteobacteria bacterium]|nr:carboxymuconolactone decarboxylase family protein [Alphaproteobacteria bacterium]
MTYPVHTETTAPENARAILAQAKGKFGFIPNLLGTMANAPALLKSYLTLAQIFEETSLTPTEQQIVLLAASYSNGCTYCIAAHTVIAGMKNVPAEVVASLRNNKPIKDAKLEALRLFAFDVTEKRGHPSEESLKRFLAAGYTPVQVLEVVLGVGFKTLSNYTNHLTKTQLDSAFSNAIWTEAKQECACCCA